MFHRFRK